jgi:hypothetical protein
VPRDRQSGEEAAIVGGKAFLRDRPRDAGEVLEAVAAADLNVLSRTVVVVAAYSMSGLVPDPVDARRGFQQASYFSWMACRAGQLAWMSAMMSTRMGKPPEIADSPSAQQG